MGGGLGMSRALGMGVGVGLTSGRGNSIRIYEEEPATVKVRGKTFYLKQV